MGCDIHGDIEKKVDGKWIHYTRIHREAHAISSRDYGVFAVLAGVRKEQSRVTTNAEPLGLPEDITESTLLHYKEMEFDAHSCSFLSIAECAKRIKSIGRYAEGRENFTAEDNFDLYETNDYRFVFWFDN